MRRISEGRVLAVAARTKERNVDQRASETTALEEEEDVRKEF